MAVITGCSLNAEVTGEFKDSEREKLDLLSFSLSLSGSSAVVAGAINACGGQASTFGLVGPDSIETKLLQMAGQSSSSAIHFLEVLDQTNFAFLPIDHSRQKQKVAGRKGMVVPEKVEVSISNLKGVLKGFSQGFGVMTGLRGQELPFAEVVFGSVPHGKRILSPRFEFCSSTDFFDLLREVDCLVMNESEFEKTGQSPSDIVSQGPKAIIVTKGKKGGVCFLGKKRIAYDSVSVCDEESPGTGDWFLGAFIAFLDSKGLSFDSLDEIVLEKALRFAACVAGHKARIPGSSNGPSADLIQSCFSE